MMRFDHYRSFQCVCLATLCFQQLSVSVAPAAEANERAARVHRRIENFSLNDASGVP
jgi:hypothetical protein